MMVKLQVVMAVLRHPECGIARLLTKAVYSRRVRVLLFPFLCRHPHFTYLMRLAQELCLFGSLDDGTPAFGDVLRTLQKRKWPFYGIK